MKVETKKTEAEVAASVAEMAREAFAKHEVMYLSRGEWRVGRLGSSTYHFRMIVRPMTIIVWGDLGDWIIRMSDAYAIPWLRVSVRSPAYLIEKIAASREDRETFYLKDAIEWLLEGSRAETAAANAGEEHDPRYDEALNQLDEDSQHEDFLDVMHELHFDDYATIGVGPSARCFWLVEALKWFVEHADWSEVEPEAVVSPLEVPR